MSKLYGKDLQINLLFRCLKEKYLPYYKIIVTESITKTITADGINNKLIWSCLKSKHKIELYSKNFLLLSIDLTSYIFYTQYIKDTSKHTQHTNINPERLYKKNKIVPQE